MVSSATTQENWFAAHNVPRPSSPCRRTFRSSDLRRGRVSPGWKALSATGKAYRNPGDVPTCSESICRLANVVRRALTLHFDEAGALDIASISGGGMGRGAADGRSSGSILITFVLKVAVWQPCQHGAKTLRRKLISVQDLSFTAFPVLPVTVSSVIRVEGKTAADAKATAMASGDTRNASGERIPSLR